MTWALILIHNFITEVFPPHLAPLGQTQLTPETQHIDDGYQGTRA